MRALLVISFLAHAVVWGQKQISASVSSSEVETGDQFVVTVKTNSFEQVTRPSIPSGLKLVGQDSRLLNGTMYQTRVNGKVVTRGNGTVAHYFQFQAVTQGSYEIGEFTLTDGGKTLETSPLSVRVKKSTPKPQGAKGEILFVDISVSKRKVHVGEPVRVSYRLFHRYNLAGLSKQPEFDEIKDCHKTELTDPNSSPKWQVKNIGGYRYQYATFYEVLIIPQQAGTIDLGDISLEGIIQTGFFRTVKKPASASGGSITVEALPTLADFDGAVGKYDFTYELNDSVLDVGQPVEIKIKVEGKGNLGLFDLPSPEFPSQFQVFEPIEDEKIKATGSGFKGSLTKIFTAVPNYDGDFTIPEYVFYYFDTDSDELVKHHIPAISLRVGKGGNPLGEAIAENGTPIPNRRSEVETEVKDIAHIVPVQSPYMDVNESPTSKTWYWVAASSPVWGVGLCSLLLIGFRRKDEKGLQEDYSSKLKKAKSALKQGDHSACYDHLESALKLFLDHNDLNKVAGRTATHTELEENLKLAGIPEGSTTEFLRYLSDCELAKYGGGDHQNAQKMLDDVERVLLEVSKSVAA